MTVITDAEVLRVVRFSPFRYTRIESVVMSLPLEHGYSAHVIGDPDNAAYEFVIFNGPLIAKRSDVCYGNCLVALRDALIAHFGMPQQPI
jgi:hypothetical protein